MTQKTITFEQIYDETNKRVSAHTLRVIKNLHDSKDVTMKVFAKISRLNKNPLTRFNPEKSTLNTWVHMITNGVILDYFRTNHSKKFKNVCDFIDSDGNEFFEFEASKQNNADANILNKELEQRIIKAFHGLKSNYRRIGVLYFIREHTYEEISNILNIPMGSVKGNIARARKMLQTELKDLHKVKATA